MPSAHVSLKSHEIAGLRPVTLAATVLAALFIGATLPTPLYPIYRRDFGFSEIMLTLIFAVYVVGNLAALFLVGRLSDQAGRRKVMLLAIGTGMASTIAFVVANSVAWLFIARVLTGFASGVGAGTATAWIAELHPRASKAAATRIACTANFIGIAIGPLLAGLLAQYAPLPLRLAWFVNLAVLAAIALPTLAIAETVPETVDRVSDLSLRPRLGVPADIRLQFLSPAVTAFAIFAVMGFYAALIPNMLAEALHLGAPAIAGAIVFALFAVATLTTVLTGEMTSRSTMLSGLVLLFPSLLLLVLAERTESMLTLVLAAACGGVCAALGYRGSLEVVNRIAPDERRAEVISTYLITVYAGNALPVIGVGVLSAWTGAEAAHRVFAAVIAVLAAAALLTGAKYAPRQ
jgi:MFS family permease